MIEGASRPGTRWRHQRDGQEYVTEGTTTMKSRACRELDDEILVLYRDSEGRRYARELAEFESLFEEGTPLPRSCNQHGDCDAADREAADAGGQPPRHCRVEDCEDCFGT